MRIQKGKKTYCYKSIRIDGKPKSIYLGASSSPQAKAYEQKQEEKKQQQNREEEMQRLNEQLENALKLIKIMERGYLLVAGYYERKSEIRKLQEAPDVH